MQRNTNISQKQLRCTKREETRKDSWKPAWFPVSTQATCLATSQGNPTCIPVTLKHLSPSGNEGLFLEEIVIFPICTHEMTRLFWTGTPFFVQKFQKSGTFFWPTTHLQLHRDLTLNGPPFTTHSYCLENFNSGIP